MDVDADPVFFDVDDLLDRLTEGLKSNKREVVFVVGSPLTAPVSSQSPDVPSVNQIVTMIKDNFSSSSTQLRKLESRIETAENKYQAAFMFMHGTRGQDAINQTVRQAVLMARIDAHKFSSSQSVLKLTEEDFISLDDDIVNWCLNPGLDALAELTSIERERFGNSIITSNFDPLVEIGIKKHNGQVWRTALHSDGSLEQSVALGTRIIHIHGFWHGSDTLHTGSQLGQKRPGLKNSIMNFLLGKIVVVIAYGGCRDIFTEALSETLSDSTKYPDVLWTFFDDRRTISPFLTTVLGPAMGRNRVTFYNGVDCDSFFPRLLKYWKDFGSSEISRLTGFQLLPIR